MLDSVHWLGHASFRIEGTRMVYIDPWKLKDPVLADLVLITHGHHDHLSPKDIARIQTDATVLVCPSSCAEHLEGDVRIIAPGETLDIGPVRVEAVPSYNTNKPNHPRAAGNVGYILEMDGRRIYHAGDTDYIAEMASIRCDVALLPVGGTYTMDAAEAVEAVRHINPRVVVPMHWGAIVGSSKDIDELRKKLPPEYALAVLEAE
ncbi:MAG: MBL fold metallo-hydrolase [Anaerolineae bacterium]